MRHVVLFRFRTGVTWADPRAVAAERATADHPRYIKDILGWEFGRNLSSRPIAYDFALIGTFADQAAIDRYLNHPDHLRGVRLWEEIATWVMADF
jgi:stress responsive alpha/beta barrel protein